MSEIPSMLLNQLGTCTFFPRTYGKNVICWNALQEIQTIKSTFKQGKYLCLFYKLVIFFCSEIISSLNCFFIIKKTERTIFNTSFFSVHGKELVEEIKSETSGDLQTTLIKLAEVWDTIISMYVDTICVRSSYRAWLAVVMVTFILI